MASYAQGTTVSVIKTIGELDALLEKHGATGFAYGRDDTSRSTRVMFRLADRMCRFEVKKPEVADFMQTNTYRRRTLEAATQLADAEERRRWRALLLVVKALLVGVTDGVISLSDAFLSFTVLPNGATVGEWAAPQLDTAYATATMPALMPGAAPAQAAIAAPVDLGGQQ